MAWADGVTITGNAFTAPAARPAGGKPSAADLRCATRRMSAISGNQIKASDAYAQPFVTVGGNVTQLTQDTEAPHK